MKSALILGAGIMQGPSIRAARALGWRVVVADANPRAVARGLADRFEQVDLRDREGMLELARRIAREDGLAAVFTAGTDFSTTVSYVAGALGLPAVPLEAAERATDKCMMRRSLQAAGVPCPAFTCWDGTGDPVEACRGVPFPAVVKPVDSMGARAVRRVEGPAELDEACREAVGVSRSRRAVVEEYLEGPELSLDAIVSRGEVTICGVADRTIRFPPWFVEMGHTMPTGLPAEERRAAEGVFRAGIRALGIDEGAAKGDIKLTPRGPVVGEIAARLSGGYMSGWTWPLSSGREVTEAALRIAAGEPPGDCRPTRSWTAAERAFISAPGVVGAVEGLEAAWAPPAVQEVFLLAREGSEVVFPTNNVQKCGNVIAAHADRGTAVAAAEAAAGAVLVRLRPLEPRTDAFLFGPAPQCRHPCFGWAVEANRQAIERMPPYAGDPASWDPAGPVVVLPVPGLESEPGRDWHGHAALEAFQRSARRAGLLSEGESGAGRFALGGIFWRAFGRGSVQAAAYLADSLRESAARGRLAAWLRSLPS